MAAIRLNPSLDIMTRGTDILSWYAKVSKPDDRVFYFAILAILVSDTVWFVVPLGPFSSSIAFLTNVASDYHCILGPMTRSTVGSTISAFSFNEGAVLEPVQLAITGRVSSWIWRTSWVRTRVWRAIGIQRASRMRKTSR